MINGVHALIYAKDAAKVRAFFRDVLKFPSIDAGEGWLIFALPPAELGIHPAEEDGQASHQLYLLCDDLQATIEDLKSKGVECGEVHQAPWGSVTSITLPDGTHLGLYQPKHPTALNLG